MHVQLILNYQSVLEDYIITEKWTLKHNVSHSQLFGREYSLYALYFSVFSVHPQHNLLFIVGGDEKTLMSYDVDSIELHFIRQVGSDCQVEWSGWDRKTTCSQSHW